MADSNCGYGNEMVLAFRRWRRTASGKKILFILGAGVIIVIINVVCGISFMDGLYSVEYSSINSVIPLARLEGHSSEIYIRQQRRQKRLAIFQKIFEKQNRRSSRISNQTCQHPHLDLKHDTNTEAFHSMPKLNCTGESLFYLHNKAARLNQTVLQGKELGKCMYYGIERMTDEFFTYTESLEKTEPPYDLILSHDFLRIQCKYKTTENEEAGNMEYPNQRRLMSFTKRGSRDASQYKDSNSRLSSGQNLPYRKKSDIAAVVRFSQQNPKKNQTNFIQKPVTMTNTQPLNVSLKSSVVSIGKVQKGDFYNSNHSKINRKPMNKTKPINVYLNTSAISTKKFQQGSSHKNEKNFSETVKETTSAHMAIKASALPTRKLQHVDIEEGEEVELKEPMNGVENFGQEVPAAPDMDKEEEGEVDPFDQGHGWEDDMFDYQQFMGAESMDTDFDQFLIQIVPKPEVFQRISKVKKSKRTSNMNVMVFALDSMSHLSYQRKLPLTYKYLKEQLGATFLNGYNIVGDATTAAIIPMMTGKTEVELPEVRKEQEDANYLDVYPFVWKRFKDAGYATLYAEDEPSIGTFNLRFNGFQEPPTDHYMRPFWQALWESGLRSKSPRYCTGSTPNHVYLLDYIKDFFVKYHNVSKFVFGFSGELTHWDNNPGEYIDEDLANFLHFLHTKGYLDNTMLVVMGDHGARYSKVRKTVQGKLEERMPLMSVVMPQWFHHEYPQVKAVLRQNSQRLTTPFDIHETFLDLLNVERLQVPINHEQRGMSILRDIPANRTCASARIDIHWCACVQQIQVSHEDKFVVMAAEKVVEHINMLTQKLRNNCTELTLKMVYSAFLVLPNEQVLKFTHTSDPDQRLANFSTAIDLDKAHYQITLETSPSEAIYEVTVEVDFRNETYVYHVTPEISRINLYGDQPKCVQKEHPDLRKFCYCRDVHNPENSSEKQKEKREKSNHYRPRVSPGAS